MGEVMVGTAANAVKQTLTPLLNQKLSHVTTMVTIHTTLDTIISARDLLKLSHITSMVTIHTHTLDTTTSARDLLKLNQKASHITDIMVDMVALATGEARDLLMPSQKLSPTIMVMDIIHTLDITGVRYAEATMH